MKNLLNINSTFMTYLGLFLLSVVAVAMVLAIAYSESSNIVSFSINVAVACVLGAKWYYVQQRSIIVKI